ncbi:hypothetical protein BD309DRAFT_205056 [Dichomitus squalens]|nr:hypothetical protein BD309DRAFT_205056 [Dichomitus squalens]
MHMHLLMHAKNEHYRSTGKYIKRRDFAEGAFLSEHWGRDSTQSPLTRRPRERGRWLPRPRPRLSIVGIQSGNPSLPRLHNALMTTLTYVAFRTAGRSARSAGGTGSQQSTSPDHTMRTSASRSNIMIPSCIRWPSKDSGK